MSVSTKILLFLGGAVLLGLLGFVVYQQFELSKKQQAIDTQMIQQKELADNIMRSQNSYATKDDIATLIKQNGVNLQAIQDDLSKLHAEVSAVNTIIVSSKGQHTTNVPTSSTGSVNPHPVDPKNPDPNGYLSKQQNLDLNEDFNGATVPIGQVGFSAWQKNPWSVSILPREYHIVNVLGTDENQRTYVYNKVSIKSGEKTYDVKITQSQTEQEYPEAKWSWFNPRLYAGIDGGINVSAIKGEFTPNINVSFMSYGQYKTQPDFSVLGVGVGYGTISKTPELVLTPVTYNIGKHIPLMNNTYIGPSVQIVTNGQVSIMTGIRVGL